MLNFLLRQLRKDGPVWRATHGSYSYIYRTGTH